MNKKNTFLTSMLVVAAILTMTIGILTYDAGASFNGTASAEPSVWDGASSDTSWYNDIDTTFTLTTASQIRGLAMLTNDAYYPKDFYGRTIELGADIDLNNMPWTPIDTFHGTFDGKGHTISNMLVNGIRETALGFFGKSNLAIKITNTNFNNCHVATTAAQGCYYAGIIIGQTRNYFTRITNCTVTNSTVTACRFSGIIAGYCSGGILVKDCMVNSCAVNSPEGNASTYNDFGGVIGVLDGNSIEPARIENCSVIDYTTNSNTVVDDTGIFVGNEGDMIDPYIDLVNCNTNLLPTTELPLAAPNEQTKMNIAGMRYGVSYIKADDVDVSSNITIEGDALQCVYVNNANAVEVGFPIEATDISLTVDGVTHEYTYENKVLSFSLTDGCKKAALGFKVGTKALNYTITTGFTFAPQYNLTINDVNFDVSDESIYHSGKDYYMVSGSRAVKLSFTDIDEGVTVSAKINGTLFSITGNTIDLGTISTDSKVEIYVSYNGTTSLYDAITLKFLNATGYDNVYYGTDATYGWALDSELSTSQNVFKSGNNGQDNTTSTIYLYVFNSDTLTFNYDASGEQNYDKMYINNGGSVLEHNPGPITTLTWPTYTTTFEDDSMHMVSVYFAKDASSASGSDAAWIKNIVASNSGASVPPAAQDCTITINYNAAYGTVYNRFNFADTIMESGVQYTVPAGTRFILETETIVSGFDSSVVLGEKTLTVFEKYVNGSTENLYSTYDFRVAENTIINVVIKEAIPFPSTIKATKIVNGFSSEITVSEGDEIQYAKQDVNQIVALAPVLNLGEQCHITINGTRVDTPMAEESGYFYYKIENLNSLIKADISLAYTLDGYMSEVFSYSAISATASDLLIKEGSDEITVINDDVLPFVYDTARSTDTFKVFKAGNVNINASVSNIGFVLKGSGLLSFDAYISSESNYDLALYRYGDKIVSYDASHGELYLSGDKATSSGNIGWKTYNISITAESDETETTIYIGYAKDGSGPYYDDTLAIANVGFFSGSGMINYSVTNSDAGSVNSTVAGEAYTSGEAVVNGSNASLTAVVNDGYFFYGWLDENGKLVSFENTISTVVAGTKNYQAIIDTPQAYAARIGGTFFASLSDAITAATSGDTVYVFKDATISENLEIPENVTVLLSYAYRDVSGTMIGTAENAGERVSWVNEATYLYKTLTVASDVSLTVNGTLIIGGVQHYPNQSAQGHTSGAYSQIVNNGSIVVNGSLDNRGRITGTGTITANGVLRTPFMVNNFSGGTNTEAHYLAGYFPFVQFSTVNIECNQVINYGAKVIGATSLYAMASVHTQDVVLIDKIENKGVEGSLIWMEAGSRLEISYDGTKRINGQVGNINLADSGVTSIEVFGAVTAGEFYLQGYGSGAMVLALPYTYDITVADGGTLNIPADRQYMVMPGAVLSVNDGGNLNVSGGLYVLDGLIQADKSGKLYPGSSVLKTNGFSASGTLIVDGKVTVAASGKFAGIAQATANTGVLEIMSGATTNITLTLGSVEGYAGCNDQAVLSLSARVSGLYANEIAEIESGKTYRAYNSAAFTLASFSMDSAARITELSATINQSMTGSFGEVVSSTEIGVYRDIYIGEAVEGVKVNVSGTLYTSNASGILEDVFVKFGEAFTFEYFTVGKQTNTFTESLSDSIVLTQVIKDATLAEDNVYRKVFNAEGTLVTDFALNAVLNYYGGTQSAYIALSNTFNSELYAESVALTNAVYTVCSFTHELQQATAAFADYIATVNALASKTSAQIVSAAVVAYAEYSTITDGRNSDELDFVDEYLADYKGYFGIRKSFTVTSAVYGSNGTATATCVDGTSAVITVITVPDTYEIVSGNIHADYIYDSTYLEISYSIESAYASVAQRAITVTVGNSTSVYGDADAAFNFEITDGTAIDPIDDIVTASRVAGTTVGNYDITANGKLAYYNVTFVFTDGTHSNYSITARPITVTIADKTSVYGDDIVDLTAVVEGDIIGSDEPYSLQKAEGDTVQDYAITGNTTNTNYSINFIYTQVDHSVYSITARPTNVTVANHSNVMLSKIGNIRFSATRAWDGANLTGISFKIMSGDVHVATAAADGTVTVVEGKTFGVGDYDVLAIYSDINFEISHVAGSLVVVEDNSYYDVDFSFEDGDSKTYDGTAFTYTVSVKIAETQAELIKDTNYTVSVVKNGTDVVTEIKTTGSYEVKVTIVGEDVEYTSRCSITTRPITVTIADKTSSYGDAIVELTATVVGGVIGGDDPYSLKKADGITADEYAITGTKTNNNYNIVFVDGVYTITRRELSVTIADKSSEYGEAIVALSATTADTFAFTDTMDSIVRLTKATGNAAGDYAITGTCNDTDNYDITFENEGVYTITPRSINVTLNSATSVYGEADAAITFALADGSTLGYSDLLGAVVKASRAAGKDVAEYAITGTCINANYSVEFNNDAKYEITVRPITVTLDNKTSIYGDSFAATTARVTLGSIADGDTTPYQIVWDESRDVGNKVISLTSINDNYDIAAVNGVYSITARPITIKVNDATSIYGNAFAELTAEVKSGSLGYDDEIADVISMTKADGASVNTYAITAESLNNANYNLSLDFTGDEKSTYTVTKREVTLTVGTINASSSDSWATVTGQYSSEITEGTIIGSDVLGITYSVTLEGSATVLTSANYESEIRGGTHTINAVTTNGNYAVTVLPGTLNVSRPAVWVQNMTTSYVYDEGNAISVFNWTRNVGGYLESANERTFRAKVYAGNEAVEDKLLNNLGTVTNAGTYTVVIEIVHVQEYVFSGTAIVSYAVTVDKKDISEHITAIGFTDGGKLPYVSGLEFAGSVGEYDELELALTTAYTYGGNTVAQISELGEYGYTVTVDDDNYCGSKAFAVTIIENVAADMTELSTKLVALESKQGSAEKLSALMEMRRLLAALTDDDLTQVEADAEYKALIEEISESWTQYVAEVATDSAIAEDVGTGIVKNVLELAAAISVAAWFSLKNLFI